MPEPPDPPEKDAEDYYFDGPYLVFTESYHRKRGYCCQSGCRHCPYGFQKTGCQSLAVAENEPKALNLPSK
ncbi:MAG TPA: DUF5522 domain-containing protein [Acidobacteriaceae bacterium]|nr:DUF5522 domain-containing protein [Acidobacteriaceae bacterium]